MENSTQSSVHIVWDDSAQVTPGGCGHGVVSSIVSLAASYGDLRSYSFYTDCSGMGVSEAVARSELQSSGVSIIDVCAAGRVGAASKMLLADAFKYLYGRHEGPSTLVVVTADPDIMYGLSHLKHQGHRVVVVCPVHCHPNVLHHALVKIATLEKRPDLFDEQPGHRSPPKEFAGPPGIGEDESENEMTDRDEAESARSFSPLPRRGRSPSRRLGLTRDAVSPKASTTARSRSSSSSNSTTSTLSLSPRDGPVDEIRRRPSSGSIKSQRSDYILVSDSTHSDGPVAESDTRVQDMGTKPTSPRPQLPVSDGSHDLEKQQHIQKENASLESTSLTQPGFIVSDNVMALLQHVPTGTTPGRVVAALPPPSTSNPPPPSSIYPTPIQTPLAVPPKFRALVTVLRQARSTGKASPSRARIFALLEEQDPNLRATCGLIGVKKPLVHYLKEATNAGILVSSTGNQIRLHPNFCV